MGLAAAGLPHVACWGLFVLAALAAWPLWVYGNEIALFERRLWLASLLPEDSRLRRLLWRGVLSRVLAVPLALVLAALLLLLVARLDALHWAILAGDVLVLSLLAGAVGRGLRGQVKEDRLGIAARRWPLLGANLLLLTLAFALADFFLAAAPDTRALPWHAVAENAFRAEGLAAVCPAAGWALGALAAAEALVRHAAQLAIPSLPDPALKLAAWALVLLHAGTLAWLFTRFLLGILALLERRRGPAGTGAGHGDAFGLAFLYTILALAVPYLYASSRLAHLDTDRLAAEARRAVAAIDPCRLDPQAREALLASLSADLKQAHASAVAAAERRIDGELDTLFAEIEPGVDRYLDWYFTVIGEYQRLAALAAGDFMALMGEQLERHLFAESGFAERLEAAMESVGSDTERQFAAAAEGLSDRTAAAAAANPCAIAGLAPGSIGPGGLDLGPLADLTRDARRAGSAAGAGAAAGIALTAKLLAKKTGTALAAKMAAKKGFQTAATLAGKVAAKKGGSILLSAAGGAALCAPGGIAAALCGVAAGAAAWVAVDKALVEVDELRLREQMRTELLDALAEEKAALAAALKTAQTAATDARAAAIEAGLRRTFLPARDGL